MINSFRHGVFLVIELGLRMCVLPKLRARLLALFGAKVGSNVRVYECRLINLEQGFTNLTLGSDVHIGNGCLIDLRGRVTVGKGTSLSPRVSLISHTDPGSAHGTPLLRRHPCEAHGVTIGEYCWVGAGATVLSGSKVGDRTVVGAMSLVRGDLDADSLYVGIPARKIRGEARHDC